jgi:hypothetical protein
MLPLGYITTVSRFTKGIIDCLANLSISIDFKGI